MPQARRSGLSGTAAALQRSCLHHPARPRPARRLGSSLLAEGAPPPKDAAAAPQHQGGTGSDLDLLAAKLARLLEPLDGSEEGAAKLASIPHLLWSADLAPEVHAEWARNKRSLAVVSQAAGGGPALRTAPGRLPCHQGTQLSRPGLGARRLAPTRASPTHPQAALEPPIPGLCSQWSADLGAFRALRNQLQLLSGSVFALGAACSSRRLGELAAAGSTPPEELHAMRGALAGALGLAASACGRAAEVLRHMPVLRPCSGEPLAHGRARWLCSA